MSIVFVPDISPNAERAVNSLYETFIRTKVEIVVTIDETWIHKHKWNKNKTIYYHQRGEKILKHSSKNLKKDFQREL